MLQTFGKNNYFLLNNKNYAVTYRDNDIRSYFLMNDNHGNLALEVTQITDNYSIPKTQIHKLKIPVRASYFNIYTGVETVKNWFDWRTLIYRATATNSNILNSVQQNTMVGIINNGFNPDASGLLTTHKTTVSTAEVNIFISDFYNWYSPDGKLIYDPINSSFIDARIQVVQNGGNDDIYFCGSALLIDNNATNFSANITHYCTIAAKFTGMSISPLVTNTNPLTPDGLQYPVNIPQIINNSFSTSYPANQWNYYLGDQNTSYIEAYDVYYQNAFYVASIDRRNDPSWNISPTRIYRLDFNNIGDSPIMVFDNSTDVHKQKRQYNVGEMEFYLDSTYRFVISYSQHDSQNTVFYAGSLFNPTNILGYCYSGSTKTRLTYYNNNFYVWEQSRSFVDISQISEFNSSFFNNTMGPIPLQVSSVSDIKYSNSAGQISYQWELTSRANSATKSGEPNNWPTSVNGVYTFDASVPNYLWFFRNVDRHAFFGPPTDAINSLPNISNSTVPLVSIALNNSTDTYYINHLDYHLSSLGHENIYTTFNDGSIKNTIPFYINSTTMVYLVYNGSFIPHFTKSTDVVLYDNVQVIWLGNEDLATEQKTSHVPMQFIISGSGIRQGPWDITTRGFIPITSNDFGTNYISYSGINVTQNSTYGYGITLQSYDFVCAGSGEFQFIAGPNWNWPTKIGIYDYNSSGLFNIIMDFNLNTIADDNNDQLTDSNGITWSGIGFSIPHCIFDFTMKNNYNVSVASLSTYVDITPPNPTGLIDFDSPKFIVSSDNPSIPVHWSIPNGVAFQNIIYHRSRNNVGLSNSIIDSNTTYNPKLFVTPTGVMSIDVSTSIPGDTYQFNYECSMKGRDNFKSPPSPGCRVITDCTNHRFCQISGVHIYIHPSGDFSSQYDITSEFQQNLFVDNVANIVNPEITVQFSAGHEQWIDSLATYPIISGIYLALVPDKLKQDPTYGQVLKVGFDDGTKLDPTYPNALQSTADTLIAFSSEDIPYIIPITRVDVSSGSYTSLINQQITIPISLAGTYYIYTIIEDEFKQYSTFCISNTSNNYKAIF